MKGFYSTTCSIVRHNTLTARNKTLRQEFAVVTLHWENIDSATNKMCVCLCSFINNL